MSEKYSRPNQGLVGLMILCVFIAILPYSGTVALRLSLLLVLSLFAIVQYISFRHDIPFLPAVTRFFMPWLLVSGVSLIYSIDFAYSLGEIKNEIVYTFLAFWSAWIIVRSEIAWRWFARAVVCSGIVMTIWMAVHFAYNHSWYINAKYFPGVAMYSGTYLMLWPVLAWVAWRERGIFYGYFAVVALLGCTTLAIGSMQRTLWVGVAAQVLALTMLGMRDQSQWRHRRWILVLGAIFISAALVAAVTYMRYGLQNIAGVNVGDIRFAVWDDMLVAVLEHPLWGAGFGREAMKMLHPELIPQSNTEVWHAHNLWLDYGFMMGVPGILCALLWLYGLVTFYARKMFEASARQYALLGIMIAVGMVVRNMTNDTFVREQSLIFWTVNGALLGLITQMKAITQPRNVLAP